MASLSSPTVSEPLYECAGLVGVEGSVPGANVMTLPTHLAGLGLFKSVVVFRILRVVVF